MKTGGITFHSNNGQSCGLNPFCHISRFIGSIMICLVLGCILCSVGYFNLSQPSRTLANWVAPATLEKQQTAPCCETTCVCNSTDFPDTTRQTGKCCRRIFKNGGDWCSSDIRPTCTKKCIDPCFNCKSSRKYKLGDKTGTKIESISKQPDCFQNSMDEPIYANPNDINDSSNVPTTTLRKMGISSLSAGALSIVCFFITLFVLYKSGRFLVKSVFSSDR